MGIFNKLSKMKNFLFDDEEEEEKEIKKVAAPKQVEDNSDKDIFNKKNKIEEDDFSFDTKKDDDMDFDLDFNNKSRVEKKEFEIPEVTENDFLIENPVIVEPEPIKKVEVKQEIKPILYQGSKKRKEEVKRFKPTPIISPIYGLLDEKGNKVTKEKTKEILSPEKDETTLDEIRRKAFGIKSDVDKTLKENKDKSIEEVEDIIKKQEEKEEEQENILNQIKELDEKIEKVKNDELNEEKSSIIVNEEDDEEEILPTINFKEFDVDLEHSRTKKMPKIEEIKKDEDDEEDDDTKEQDLFNLIDTIYKEDK